MHFTDYVLTFFSFSNVDNFISNISYCLLRAILESWISVFLNFYTQILSNFPKNIFLASQNEEFNTITNIIHNHIPVLPKFLFEILRNW